MARMFRPGWGEQYPGIHGLCVAQGGNDALYVSARPYLNFERMGQSDRTVTRNSNMFKGLRGLATQLPALAEADVPDGFADDLDDLGKLDAVQSN
jgi:hypothetical protein